MFNMNTVTIPQTKYEELIRTSQKYDILYRIVYNRFQDLFDGILENLKEIDLDKINEILEKEEK